MIVGSTVNMGVKMGYSTVESIGNSARQEHHYYETLTKSRKQAFNWDGNS